MIANNMKFSHMYKLTEHSSYQEYIIYPIFLRDTVGVGFNMPATASTTATRLHYWRHNFTSRMLTSLNIRVLNFLIDSLVYFLFFSHFLLLYNFTLRLVFIGTPLYLISSFLCGVCYAR